jgi:hypothetical protein
MYFKYSKIFEKSNQIKAIHSLIKIKYTGVQLSLSNKSTSSCWFIFPHRWKLLRLLIIPTKTMNPTLNQNQPKFRILILPIPLQMLPNRNRLLDQVIQIFRNLRSKTMSLEYTQNLASVILLTWEIPWESWRITPIWDGDRPFLANLHMVSSTSWVEILIQVGGVLL